MKRLIVFVSAFKYSSSSEEVPFKLSSTPTFK